MKERLLKTKWGSYVPAQLDGGNASGWKATGDRVIIKTDRAPQQTRGGIMLTEETQDVHDDAAITGVIVDVGDDAFTWNSDRSRKWQGDRPRPGDRVIFTKYAGELLFGDDDQLYRVMEDRAIGAISRTPQS